MQNKKIRENLRTITNFDSQCSKLKLLMGREALKVLSCINNSYRIHPYIITLTIYRKILEKLII